MSSLKQPVLVTGATSGLGQAIAGYLCDRGVPVYAGYRHPDDADRLQRTLGELATPLRIDISQDDEINAAAQWMAKHSPGGLSGLVNNAGIAVAGPIECLPIEELQQQFEVNVVGAVRTTQACLPLLRQASGRIVHIGSASGSFALPFVGAYAASKYAIEAIADAMRRELRPLGTHVILVRPGRIDTGIFDRAETEATEMVERLPAEQRFRYEPMLRKFQSLMHRSAVKRQQPERVAAVVSRALHARRPRARYEIGIDAHVSKQVAKWAPDWLSDWVVSRVIK